MNELDELNEECGVFGIVNNDNDALKTSEIIYFRTICASTQRTRKRGDGRV